LFFLWHENPADFRLRQKRETFLCVRLSAFLFSSSTLKRKGLTHDFQLSSFIANNFARIFYPKIEGWHSFWTFSASAFCAGKKDLSNLSYGGTTKLFISKSFNKFDYYAG